VRIEEKYHEPIMKYINEHGESGVNAIAAGIKMPLSSVHKYLERQDYFKKTPNKKWDSPEKVATNLATNIENNRLAMLAQSMNTQSILVSNNLDMFSATILDLLSQISSIASMLAGFSPTVAGISPNIHPLMIQTDKEIKEMYEVINKYLHKCPEEYRDLLKNVDLYAFVIKLGSEYVKSTFNGEVAALVLGEATELSEDTFEVLKTYQKET
jgi:hypothetical protein